MGTEVLKFIAYYRVSTKRQGQSGLGLEAQQAAVSTYLAAHSMKPIGEFTEVESGKRDDRPELTKALKACRLTGATLVIAKLDRLARDAAFLLNLQKAGVRFVACDMPDVGETVVGFMAVLAQTERELISKRTKEALRAAKARGVKLGTAGPQNLRNRRLGSQRGNVTNSRRAQAKAEDLADVVMPMVERGASLRAIAAALMDDHIETPRGGQKWSAVQVKRVIDRLQAA